MSDMIICVNIEFVILIVQLNIFAQSTCDASLQFFTLNTLLNIDLTFLEILNLIDMCHKT